MNKPFTVLPIQTDIFKKNESLTQFIIKSIDSSLVQEEMILAVTSKVVSLSEGRLVSKDSIEKAKLIDQEADFNLGEGGFGCFLTIKQGLFIPSAGIDESNSESGEYILYPLDPFLSARKIWEELRKVWNLQSLGIVLTDSHTTPLRRGVTGISLSHWGFQGVNSMVGTADLFGRTLQMTNINVADGLAAAATLMMGEGKESQPLAVLSHPNITFGNETSPDEVKIPLEQDLYLPLFRKLLKD